MLSLAKSNRKVEEIPRVAWSTDYGVLPVYYGEDDELLSKGCCWHVLLSRKDLISAYTLSLPRYI